MAVVAEVRACRIIAIVLSVLALVGVLASQAFYGKALDDLGKSLNPETTTSKVEPGGADPSASSGGGGQSGSHQTYSVGDTAQVQRNEKPAAKITISKATSSTKAFDTYAEKPQNGSYKHVTVEVRRHLGTRASTSTPMTGTYGTRTAPSTSTVRETTPAGMARRSTLEIWLLASGHRARFSFDAPSGAKDLIYAPGYDSESAAIWRIK